MKNTRKIIKVVLICFVSAFLSLNALSIIFLNKNPEHKIRFLDNECIIPYKEYNYLTCAEVNVLIDNHKIKIPKSLNTDLASIPHVLWSIISPGYVPFIGPAILHDYLYACHNDYSRYDIDNIFYSALLNNNVNRLTAYEIYLAVRLFGGDYFVNGKSCERTI